MREIILIALLLATPLICQAQEEYQYQWNEKKSWHFYIYYRNADKKYIEEVKDKAEEYYWKLEDELGFLHLQWKGKIYIYDNKEDYIEYTGQPTWSLGCANYRENTIESFSDNRGFLANTLPHELGHLIFNEFLGGKQVPLCLGEGVSQYLEQTRRTGFSYTIKEAIKKGKFIPLPRLFKISDLGGMDEEDVHIFYAESVGIIKYLVNKHGKSSFSSFLKELRDSRDLEAALRWGFSYNSILELNEEWLKYLGR